MSMQRIDNIPAAVENAPAAGSVQKSGDKSDFHNIMHELLTTHEEDSVSEEELFAAVVGQQIAEVNGPEALQSYQMLMQTATDKHGDYRPMESMAKNALSELAATDQISAAEADSIYAKAFVVSQLDENDQYLFDHKSNGESDQTKATAHIDDALEKAYAQLQEVDSGHMAVPNRLHTETTPGFTDIVGGEIASAASASSASAAGHASASASASGFLFKPISEADGNLVILTPAALTGAIHSVRLMDPEGQLIEEGRFTSVANGGREHFRFSRSGGSYPDNVGVEITLKNGSNETITIPNPANRYT